MIIHQQPALTKALLEVCAAVTYADFADAAVRFCRTAVPHKSGEVLLSYLDFDSDHALLSRSDFSSKRGATPEERTERQHAAALVNDFMEKHQPVVYRGQGHVLPPMAELEKTRWFREFMVPEGWHDFLGMGFRSGGQVHSTLFINRGFDQPAFTAGEAAVFEQAYPYFAAALQRVRLLENARAIRVDLESSLLDLPVATLLLDWQLNIEQSNHTAARMCNAWKHGLAALPTLKLHASFEVPAELRQACVELREAWSQPGNGGLRLLRRTLVHPEHPGLQATITLLRPHSLRLAAPTFLVRITEVAPPGPGVEATVVQERQDTAFLSRLSPAERELVPLLRRGLSNKEIAAALNKAVPTVKKQLHSILEKNGLASRARLIALLK